SASSAPVTPATVPGVPTAVAASAGNAQASVSWTAPASNGGRPISGYAVTSSPSGKTCTTGGTIGCTVSGLTNGTSYTFRVTATNSLGSSAPSTASTSTRVDTTPPTVTGPAAIPAVGSTIGSAVPTKLTWAGSDSGSGIGHYEVWLSTNAGSYVLVATPTTPSYTRSLTASTTTTYRFRARAVDATGNVS